MSGQPVKHAVMAELRHRAVLALGEGASVLDYICDYTASGGRIASLAQSIGTALGRPVSRSFLSGLLNRLAPDAKERLAAARRESAEALVDEAAQLADSVEAFPASVSKAALQVKTRLWNAERLAPDVYGQKASVSVKTDIGALMLDALRRPIAELRASLPDAQSGDSDDQRPAA